MKRMVDNLLDTSRRVVRIMLIGTKSELLHAFTHPGNTIATILGKVLRVALVLLMYWTISSRVPHIPLWSTERFLFLGITFYSIDLCASVLFHRNLLYYLPNDIHSGRLDRFLVQPLPVLPRMMFQRLDILDAATAIVVCGYGLGYILVHDFMFMHIVQFFVLCVLALIATAGVVLIFGSLSFFTEAQDESGHVVDAVMSLARFPATVFPQGIREVLLYVLPTGLLATLPVIALFDGASLWTILFVVIYTSVIVCCGLMVWKRGLRSYQSFNG